VYVHRAGCAGRSILFVNRVDDARIVEAIESAIGRELEVLEMNEMETVGWVKRVLAAKRDARVVMFERGFGEREKRVQSIKEARNAVLGTERDA
jgi:superfamily II DNA/RNA helicase